MTPETQQHESPYCVRIETGTGQSSTVPIAFLTPKQVEVFLQSEFKRLAQEAGVKEPVFNTCAQTSFYRPREYEGHLPSE
jgi:hypothetical protein